MNLWKGIEKRSDGSIQTKIVDLLQLRTKAFCSKFPRLQFIASSTVAIRHASWVLQDWSQCPDYSDASRLSSKNKPWDQKSGSYTTTRGSLCHNPVVIVPHISDPVAHLATFPGHRGPCTTNSVAYRATPPGWQTKFRDSWERSFLCSLFLNHKS